jgi:polar amino acid transport system substrate-binding protein
LFTRLTALVLAPLVALAVLPSVALALCDVEYRVQPGDTLFSIAEAHYGERQRWTLIYYTNQAVLTGPSVIPGNKLYIPCGVKDTTPDATPLRKDDAEMKILTGGNYAPFTDEELPGQGLVTELVNAVMELTPSPVSYSITWEDDWSKHLFPKLDQKEFDMGFPWYKPDCASTPDNERCVNFHFSDPLFIVPMMLFTRDDNQFTFESDADIPGKRLCRPNGYNTADLDTPERRWISDDRITLVFGENPQDCFDMVLKGDVDAASVNLFLGANTIIEMGLRNKILPLERPVSEQGLHVVISKKHWRGTTHLYRINAGLKNLRKSGRYEEIVARHLELFWAQLQ